MNVPLTPIRFLRYAGEQFPGDEAIVCGDDRFTYAQFADRAARLAGALRAEGARSGDRVAFLSTNCHRLLEASQAARRLGQRRFAAGDRSGRFGVAAGKIEASGMKIGK